MGDDEGGALIMEREKDRHSEREISTQAITQEKHFPKTGKNERG